MGPCRWPACKPELVHESEGAACIFGVHEGGVLLHKMFLAH